MALPPLSTITPSQPVPTSFPTKDARLAYFREHIRVYPKWALRALEVIYAYQTEAEKNAEATIEDNGVGFAGTDGDILTSFAKQYAKWKAETAPKYPAPFSPKQSKLLHQLMPKYAAQLIKHLETEGKAPPIVKASAA